MDRERKTPMSLTADELILLENALSYCQSHDVFDPDDHPPDEVSGLLDRVMKMRETATRLDQ